MNGEEFIGKCWKCRAVRQYIVDQAKQHAKHNKEAQEDHVQEAWLVISTVPSCPGIEGCKELAHSAVYSSYWQMNKDRLVKHNPGEINTTIPALQSDQWMALVERITTEAVEKRTPVDLFVKRFRKRTGFALRSDYIQEIITALQGMLPH